jgi:hypothetical protein
MRWPESPFVIEIFKGVLLLSERFAGTPEAAIARGTTLLNDLDGRTLLVADDAGNEVYRLHRSPLS